jgi:WD40 repeat protein
VSAGDRAAVPLKLPVVALLPGHADSLTGVAFSPNGGLLAATCRDGSVRLWDLARAEPEKLLDVRERPGPAGSPAFSPDGTNLAFACGDGVVLYDVTGEKPGRRGFVPGCTLSVPDGENPCPRQVLAFFPDGKMLCVFHLEARERSSDKTPYCCFKFWSLARWEPRLTNTYFGFPSTPERPADVHCLAMAPDFCLAYGGTRKALSWLKLDRLGNTRSGMGYGSHEDALVDMLFSPDGTTLAIAGRDGYVRAQLDNPQPVRFTRLMTPMWPVKAHDGWATVVAFTPDGKEFITSGEDRFVIWWDPRNRPPKLREWQAPAGTHLWRFSPDGRFAAIGVSGERVALVRLITPFQLP